MAATSIVRLSLEASKYEQGLKGAKRQFDDFASSIGINMKKMTAYGLAVGVAASAINKFTSEISECINQSVELAKQGEGVRLAFQRLNQPGLLDNLREATHGTVTDLELMKAAVQFQDFKLPLSELGTMLAFAQQKAKDTGQSVDYLVNSIVTGLGRKSKMILDNLGISATEIDEKMKKTGDMTKAVGEIVREQMAKAGDYVETAAERATKADVDLKNAMEDLGRTFLPLTEASNDLWSSIKAGALNALNSAVRPLIDALTEAGRIRKQYEQQGGSERVNRMIGRLGAIQTDSYRRGTYKAQLSNFDTKIAEYQQYLADYKKWQSDKTAVGAYDRMASFQKRTGLSIYSDVKEQLAVFKQERMEYVNRAKAIIDGNPAPSPTSAGDNKKKEGKGGGGKSGETSTTETEKTELQTLQSKIQELEQEYIKLGDITTETSLKRQGEIRTEIANNQKRINQIKLLTEQAHGKYQGGDVQTTGLGNIVQLPTVGKGLDKLPDTTSGVKDMTKALQEQKMALNLAGQAAQNFGAALESIGDPSAKAAGQVVSAIASIAMGFAMASSNANTAGTGWGWLAWLGAGLAAMTTTISTIHSLTGYAEGGMVNGSTYSGDQIPIMANAGEVVLTKAQQGNLASQLQNNNAGGYTPSHVSGEQIWIALNAYTKRTGKGELITWR